MRLNYTLWILAFMLGAHSCVQAQGITNLCLKDTAYYKSPPDSLSIFFNYQYTLVDSLSSGKWILYNSFSKGDLKNSEILVSGSFKDSMRNGEFRYFNGATTLTVNYKNGLLHGPIMERGQNELLYQGYYVLGQANGAFISYLDGKLSSVAMYSNDTLKCWAEYATGRLSSTGCGSDESLDGVFKFYSQEGSVILEAFYNKGTLERYKRYYPNGTIRELAEGKFKEPQYVPALGLVETVYFKPSELVVGCWYTYDEQGALKETNCN